MSTKLNFEQRQRASLIAESRGIDDDTAFELVYLRDKAAELSTPTAAPLDALHDEVQRRMDAVVEAAVEWHQAGREGTEWFDKAEVLSATIDSLLELRATAPTQPEPPPSIKPRPPKT